MKIRLYIKIFFIMVFLITSMVHIVQAENAELTICYFVAPYGLDTNAGTIEAPFATLEKARDAIRELKSWNNGLPIGGVTVYLRGGEYFRQSEFLLEAQDSGSENSPITYKAYQNEDVKIIGSKKLDHSLSQVVVDSEILSKIPQEAHGKVIQIDLKSQDITNYGLIKEFGHKKINNPPAELIFNDNVMTLARWPNEGYVKTGEPVFTGSVDPIIGITFRYNEARPLRWTDAKDAWLHGYWYWDWSDHAVPIETIDSVNMRITTKLPTNYGVRSNQRYYAFNLLEELDAPGEYYIDRDTGILYFYPPSSTDNSTMYLTQSERVLFRISGADYIRIKDITLGFTRGKVIQISGGNNNIIDNCTISNAGTHSIGITGINNGIANSTINNVNGGIILGSSVTNNRTSLLNEENFVVNCDIYNFSRLAKTYFPAILVFGVGNRILHNKIHDAPHSAIIFYYNDHVIEYNEIFNVCKEADDAGAIYSGRSHTYWGNKINNNYFHDIHGITAEQSRFNQELTHAIYLDDTLSGIEIKGNIFYNVNDALAASGSDIVFRNNIIVDSNKSVFFKSEAHGVPIDCGYYEEERVFNPDNSIDKDILSVPYKSDIWVEKYPDLVKSIEQTYGPMRVTIDNNVLYNTASLSLNSNLINYGFVKDNVTYTQDPGFLDIINKDFRLRNDSTIYTQVSNFEKIFFENIGNIVSSGIKLNKLSFFDSSGNVARELTPSEDIYIKTDVFNNSDKNCDVSIIAGIYDNNGRLVKVEQKGNVIRSYKLEKDITLKVSIPINVNATHMKIFIWDSINGIKPLEKAITF